jgi:hypothetical protein
MGTRNGRLQSLKPSELWKDDSDEFGRFVMKARLVQFKTSSNSDKF